MVPTYVPRFTYIIPFRFRIDRILPLRRVLDWLSGFQGVEIMVIEQDKTSKIDFMNLKCTHIFLKSELPFNKSWAYNVGLRRAISKTIIFGEADFIMNPMELIEGLKLIEQFDCVIPTNKTAYLTPQESSVDTQNLLQIKKSQSKKNIFDGISIFKKESIINIGGWNEDMVGLGYENEFQELKLNKMLKSHQMDYLGYHLFHHPDPQPQQLLDRNKQIYEVYKNDSNLIAQHIHTTSPKIGFSNRFVINK